MTEVARLSLPAAVSTPSYQSLSFSSVVSDGVGQGAIDRLQTKVEDISHAIVMRQFTIDLIRGHLDWDPSTLFFELMLEKEMVDRLHQEAPYVPLITFESRLKAFSDKLEDEVIQLQIELSDANREMEQLRADQQAAAARPIQAVVAPGFGRDP